MEIKGKYCRECGSPIESGDFVEQDDFYEDMYKCWYCGTVNLIEKEESK